VLRPCQLPCAMANASGHALLSMPDRRCATDPGNMSVSAAPWLMDPVLRGVTLLHCSAQLESFLGTSLSEVLTGDATQRMPRF
jgi:hypothetical protein